METNEILSLLITALAAPLIIAIAKILLAYAAKLYAQVKASNPDRFEEIEKVAKLVVDAAEQAGLANIITDKKNYAINAAEKMLEEKGLYVDLDVIDAQIEAALFAKKQSGEIAVTEKKVTPETVK